MMFAQNVEKVRFLEETMQENIVSAEKFATMNAHVLWKNAELKKTIVKVVVQASIC